MTYITNGSTHIRVDQVGWYDRLYMDGVSTPVECRGFDRQYDCTTLTLDVAGDLVDVAHTTTDVPAGFSSRSRLRLRSTVVADSNVRCWRPTRRCHCCVHWQECECVLRNGPRVAGPSSQALSATQDDEEVPGRHLPKPRHPNQPTEPPRVVPRHGRDDIHIVTVLQFPDGLAHMQREQAVPVAMDGGYAVSAPIPSGGEVTAEIVPG